jgi:hypothetical protein
MVEDFVPVRTYRAEAACYFFFLVVPLPDRDTASGELVALLVIVSAPPRAPSAVGENFIVTLHFLRGAIVGPHPLAREKSPLATMAAKVTGVVLVLVITTRFGLLLAPAPNTTLPSFRLRGDTPSEPAGVGVAVGVRVGVALGVRVAVGVWTGVLTVVGVDDGVAEADGVDVAVALAVAVADAVGVGVGVGELVADAVADAVGVEVRVAV